MVGPLCQNQYGGAIGGPIRKNKTFFLFSYRGLKIRTSAFVNPALPPTAAERRGDFSSAPASQRPVDPDNNNIPFPNAQIPVSRFDPVALNIIAKYVPLPNTADGCLELYDGRRNDEPQYVARLDHQLSPNHRLYGTMFLVRGSGYDPFASNTQVAKYGINQTYLSQNNGVGGWDWIVRPTLLNQARYSFNNRNSQLVSQVRDSWPEFGSKVTLGALPRRPPKIFVTGRWQMGTFGESEFDQRSHNFSNTATYTRGAHTLKAGFWALWTDSIETGNWLGSGQVHFMP